jgi:hypothetical protein
MYCGKGEFIHAAIEEGHVTVSSLSTPDWEARWYGATRPLLGSGATALTQLEEDRRRARFR